MPTQLENVENRIRARIAELVGPQKFKVWFKDSTRFAPVDGRLHVGVPNQFIGQWIEDHFAEAIQTAAKEVVGEEVQISFAVDPSLFSLQRNRQQLNAQAASLEKCTPHDRRGSPAKPRSSGEAAAETRRLRGRLENFVVGPSNRLAFSVAQSLVENPTAEGPPVFLHSACGLGKTHLLQGIANGLARQHPQIRWAYATGEEFTNQFIRAIQERRLDAFRLRFRNLDVLLLDDMQFIANKRATQEEFFHTFNAIDAVGKRVVLASDANPRMIGDLSESLVSRLVAGMVVRIDRPDFATRCEILRRRAAQTRNELPPAVVEYIAERVQANVRELEGCLLKLIACASLTQIPITLDLARRTLDDHLTQSGRALSVADIEQSVAAYFGLTPADLHTSRKSRTIALARNVAMYLARKHTALSFPEIGRLMGDKDHTTVLLAHRRIGKLLEEDAQVSWRTAAGSQSRSLRELIADQEQQLRR